MMFLNRQTVRAGLQRWAAQKMSAPRLQGSRILNTQFHWETSRVESHNHFVVIQEHFFGKAKPGSEICRNPDPGAAKMKANPSFSFLSAGQIPAGSIRKHPKHL
jgi:hypothetical protein